MRTCSLLKIISVITLQAFLCQSMAFSQDQIPRNYLAADARKNLESLKEPIQVAGEDLTDFLSSTAADGLTNPVELDERVAQFRQARPAFNALMDSLNFKQSSGHGDGLLLQFASGFKVPIRGTEIDPLSVPRFREISFNAVKSGDGVGKKNRLVKTGSAQTPWRNVFLGGRPQDFQIAREGTVTNIVRKIVENDDGVWSFRILVDTIYRRMDEFPGETQAKLEHIAEGNEGEQEAEIAHFFLTTSWVTAIVRSMVWAMQIDPVEGPMDVLIDRLRELLERRPGKTFEELKNLLIQGGLEAEAVKGMHILSYKEELGIFEEMVLEEGDGESRLTAIRALVGYQQWMSEPYLRSLLNVAIDLSDIDLARAVIEEGFSTFTRLSEESRRVLNRLMGLDQFRDLRQPVLTLLSSRHGDGMSIDGDQIEARLRKMQKRVLDSEKGFVSLAQDILRLFQNELAIASVGTDSRALVDELVRLQSFHFAFVGSAVPSEERLSAAYEIDLGPLLGAQNEVTMPVIERAFRKSFPVAFGQRTFTLVIYDPGLSVDHHDPRLLSMHDLRRTLPQERETLLDPTAPVTEILRAALIIAGSA